MVEDILRCLNIKGAEKQFVLMAPYHYREPYASLGDGLAISISSETCSYLNRLGAYLGALPAVESLELNPSRFAALCPVSLPSANCDQFVMNEVGFTVAGRGDKFFTQLKMVQAVPNLESYFPRLVISRYGEIEIGFETNDFGFQCGCYISSCDLEALIHQAKSVPEREIIVHTPFGDMRINEFGFRMGAVPEAWEGSPPFRFDMGEYARFFGHPAPDSLDIDDIGYLTCECKYVHPAFDPHWKAQVK